MPPRPAGGDANAVAGGTGRRVPICSSDAVRTAREARIAPKPGPRIGVRDPRLRVSDGACYDARSRGAFSSAG